MVEIHHNLFIGAAEDYERRVRRESGWRVVHACKEPYHRAALGYAGRSAPQSHPEYLNARRGDRLILNLIDGEDPRYVSSAIVDAALDFAADTLLADTRVLIHCNQGESRAPSLGLLYLAVRAQTLPITSLSEAKSRYREIYPAYRPKTGIRGFLLANWATYTSRLQSH